jgi:uncharacterized protein YcfJ
MPASASLPSGHTAGAVAFAAGAGGVLAVASMPLHALAALVAKRASLVSVDVISQCQRKPRRCCDKAREPDGWTDGDQHVDDL